MRCIVGGILDPPPHPSRVSLLRDIREVRCEILGGASLVRFEVVRVADRRTIGIRIDGMASFATYRLEETFAFLDHARIGERSLQIGGGRMRTVPVVAVLL